MSEQNTNTWPFSEIPDADDLDISAIFGGNGTATNDNGKNPFEAPAPPVPVDAAPVTPQTPPAARPLFPRPQGPYFLRRHLCPHRPGNSDRGVGSGVPRGLEALRDTAESVSGL